MKGPRGELPDPRGYLVRGQVAHALPQRKATYAKFLPVRAAVTRLVRRAFAPVESTPGGVRDDRSRTSHQRRLVAKDAGDVLRLMLATDIAPLRQSLRVLLADSRSEASARQGLEYLEELFGAAGRQGVVMSISALATDVPADHIRALAPAYTAELLRVAAE